jgi:hypothetical protein
MDNPELKDRVGMSMALITLHSSLRPGKYSDTLQWDSTHEAFTGGGDVSIFLADNKNMYETECVTRSRWFTAFLLGAKKRMGVIRKQNEARLRNNCWRCWKLCRKSGRTPLMERQVGKGWRKLGRLSAWIQCFAQRRRGVSYFPPRNDGTLGGVDEPPNPSPDDYTVGIFYVPWFHGQPSI